MELGHKIKELRMKHRLTQEQLAEQLGVSAQSVSKWENLLTMPDVSLLPQISEVFGITIDELFDLSVEQKMTRMESKLDVEEELRHADFVEMEDYLKSLLSDEKHKYKATYLLSYLYTHRLMSDSKKIRKYAKRAILLDPTKKDCEWMLGKTGGYHCWDWDINNHNDAIIFFKEVIEKNPNASLPYYYVIDNLLIDHRADEAEYYVNELKRIRPEAIVMNYSYRAAIALARFNEPEADRIMAELEKEHLDEDGCYFEIAQYYTKKAQFEKAIDYYERSFEASNRKPRYTDELLSIATIYDILGDYEKEASTYDRILTCLHEEWNMSEEVELKNIEAKKIEALNKIKR